MTANKKNGITFELLPGDFMKCSCLYLYKTFTGYIYTKLLMV